MSNKSSIHFENVKPTSQTHNLRLREFDYVKKELSPMNQSYGDMTPHEKVINELKTIIKEKTGRTAQAKAKFLLEGVFLFNKNHTNQQLKMVADQFADEYNIVVKELHIHRDEGHYSIDNIWHPNLHAHIIIENINRSTGKSLRLNKEDLSSIQTFFAESLGMERGVTSNKVHLNAIEYKMMKTKENIEILQLLSEEKAELIPNKLDADIIKVQSLITFDFVSKKMEENNEIRKEYIDFQLNHPLKNKLFKAFDERDKAVTVLAKVEKERKNKMKR